MSNQLQAAIGLVLTAWHSHVSRTDKLFSALTDEQLKGETAAGRNSGVYLLGHLAAVHDALFPLLGIGEKLYPQLEQPFIKSPDQPRGDEYGTAELRGYWHEVNRKLAERFNQLTPEEWLQKHTAVSEEDFAKEPHRNRLNVLISRTNHLAYHLGQLIYLQKRDGAD
ncbi:MAG: DinB family protein [Chitinophagaceae bacterium]